MEGRRLRMTVYALLAVLGFVLPYSQFLPWVMENGVDLPALTSELFSTRIGAFFGLDVVVSAVVLFAWVVFEKSVKRVTYRWVVVVGTLSVGVSFGLPLYLWLRERAEAGQVAEGVST